MAEELEKFLEYRKADPNGLTEEQYMKLEEEVRHPRKGIISDECLDFRFWCRGQPSRQERFADWLEENCLKDLASHGGRPRILEVGSGRYGRLSMLLAEKGYTMTCMDPKAEILRDCAVEVRREAFHYENVDLEGYDFVAAQEPCEAAEHIVRACSQQRVPFAIALCGVPHELISGGMPEDVYEWYDYLADIDKEDTELIYVELYPEMYVAVIKSVQSPASIE